MTDLSFDEVKAIKFDFSVQENLDTQSQKVINKTTIPDYLKLFLTCVKNNTYACPTEITCQKMMTLPANCVLKNSAGVSKAIEKLAVTATVYNAYKYGNLKYGPVLFLGVVSNENLLVDLSSYNEDGMRNLPASIFSEQISALLVIKKDSNFLQFAKVRKIEPSDEYTLKMFFPRSFVLEEGTKRAQVRSDMEAIFKHLVERKDLGQLIVFKIKPIV